MVETLFAVVVGVNEPQADPPHVADQLTWGFAEISLVATALSETAAPAGTEEGSGEENEREIGSRIEIAAETDSEGSVMEVALMVTMVLEAGFVGAV
jgi:hypothetical protein